MEDTIRPQPKQLQALTSLADILFYGGGAGGGKTYALLMEAMRNVQVKDYQGVIFRRTHPMIIQEGGLWEKSCEIYPHVGARPLNRDRWIFPSGATVRFAHMQHEKDRLGWQGSQIPFISFDEVTEFSESMFWFMLSRNRSTCGVRPYVRATCNPDSESWVAKFIAWWIDQESGFPIPKRVGKLRWVCRIDDRIEWGHSWEQLYKRFPDQLLPPNTPWDHVDKVRQRPLSVTFIPSLLDDNVALESKDPAYRSKLAMLPLVERSRLLSGNWKIRPAAGLKFPRDKWVFKEGLPPGLKNFTRYWDKAYTEGGQGAMTAGVLMAELENFQALHLPQFWIIDCQSGRWGDAEREGHMRANAEIDRGLYGHVNIGIENEGGAGKQAAHASVRNLSGFSVFTDKPTQKKEKRWTLLATQQQIGNVAIYQGNWDWAQFVHELDLLAGMEALDKGKLKDKADAASGAFRYMTDGYVNTGGELLASGDPEDQEDFTKQEIKELPPFLQELVETYREMGTEINPRDDV